MENYDVFGELDELCNNNVLSKLKKLAPTASIEDDLDLEAAFEVVDKRLQSPGKKHKKKKNAQPLSPISASSNANVSPTLLPQKTISNSNESDLNESVGRRTRSSNRKRTEPEPPPAPTTSAAPAPTAPAKGKRGRKGKQAAPPPPPETVDVVDAVAEMPPPPPEPVFANIFAQAHEAGAAARRRGRNAGGSSANGVVRARRNFIAEIAARSTNVDYVDLVSSPLPRIEGVINVDSDVEEDSTSSPGHKTSTAVTKNDSLLDGSFDEENPEMSIKIIWQGNPEVFQLRKYQKFLRIFEILAEREKTAVENLVFNLDTRIISASDTPESIDYKIFQFINGRVLVGKFDSSTKKRDANKISLKIQSDKWKRPLQVDLLKKDKFKILYIKCAEELNIPYDSLKLSFDGEPLEYNATPADLDLEGGEAIDLRIKK